MRKRSFEWPRKDFPLEVVKSEVNKEDEVMFPDVVFEAVLLSKKQSIERNYVDTSATGFVIVKNF